MCNISTIETALPADLFRHPQTGRDGQSLRQKSDPPERTAKVFNWPYVIRWPLFFDPLIAALFNGCADFRPEPLPISAAEGGASLSAGLFPHFR
jgi:hypothetical protein